MDFRQDRSAPGRVRDAILTVLYSAQGSLSVKEIEEEVERVLGRTPKSSVRSYLRLNTPEIFVREKRGVYRVKQIGQAETRQTPAGSLHTRQYRQPLTVGRARLFHEDCFEWLEAQEDCRFHAVVTDPPYGLHEYTPQQQEKLRNRKGGVWRIPPSYDGTTRSPVPRFTTLSNGQLEELREFFALWARILLPKLAPGAHVLLASNPLVSHLVSLALAEAGLERRGEIVRLTMTLRGGDRPKAAHEEFHEVSVMPRSMWEPWLVYRRPLEGRVQDNLRKWGTGGLRRPSEERPFGDVITSAPTRKQERALAPHPSLKPQAFLRQVVRAVLPLGEGVVLDPFAGSGSTLAAAEAVGYASMGVEKDEHYFEVAREAIPALASYEPNGAKSYRSSSPAASLRLLYEE